MSERVNQLPVIVKDYIDTLNNRKNSMHVRENARLMLENIVQQCTKAVQDYNLQFKRKF